MDIKSGMSNIYFFEIEKEHENYFRQSLPDNDLIFFEEKLTVENAWQAKEADILSVFIYSSVDKQVIQKMPNLRFISTRSTGFEHIDLQAARQRGIEVANVPAYGENTVAEHTIALILSLFHNIHKAYVRSTEGKFDYRGLMGRDLKEKTLGIIGGGKIGMHVARIAKALGLDVQVYDLKHRHFLAEVLDFRYVSLDKLLRTSDIISLHMPLNKNTVHFIDWNKIQKMKRGAVIINTARGGLVDSAALIRGLDEGIIGGAGLDVLEGEGMITEEVQIALSTKSMENLRTLVESNILLHRENVIITPHIAYYSAEAMKRIAEVTVENIRTFLEGKPENIIAA